MNTDKPVTKASAPETRTVEDDMSKDYFVVEYANGHRQQVKRSTEQRTESEIREEQRLLARQVAHDSMIEECFGMEAQQRFERIYFTLSRSTDPNLDADENDDWLSETHG
jgi:hypothetical protein